MGNFFWYDRHDLRKSSLDNWRESIWFLIKLNDRYGFHMPRTHARDNYYKTLEDSRAARQG